MRSEPTFYSAIPLFDGIGEDEIKTLLGCLHAYTRNYRKGEFILLDQDEVQRVGVVLRGTVHMLKEDLWGHKTLLTYMGPGELFGETFALLKAPQSYVSFYAAANAQVLFLPLEHILRPCTKNCPFHDRLARNTLHMIGEKNLQLMEKIEISAKISLREKILAYLSLQAQKQGQKYITVPLNRTEMANYLQANRSAMSRELAGMKADGLIDFDGNTFVLY